MNQTQVFLAYQTLLHSIALQILRCKADAEDAVHDAFERWLSVDDNKVQNAKAYLTSMVRNISINKLRRFSFRKTESLEAVPEPHKGHIEPDLSHFDLDIDIGKALSIINHKLEPLERAVVLLREVLNFDYEVLTKIVGKKADHCRQILSRAKKKLGNSKMSFQINYKSNFLAEIFRKSCQSGTFTDLINYLKADLPAKK
jgi:RNA polymerase sigma-70 factor (ECF subfamily)